MYLLYVMEKFTYNYQGVTHESEVEYFWEKGSHKYRVKLSTGYHALVAVPYPGPNNTTLWTMSLKPTDLELSHDLVMAIGEGIERSGMPIHKRGEAPINLDDLYADWD